MKMGNRIIVFAAVTGLISVSALAVWILIPLPQVNPPELNVSDEIPDGPRSEFDSWNRSILTRFDEMPMRSIRFDRSECYRLILMPSFDHPILVQASRTEEGFDLMTKFLDGEGGYEMGKLSTSRHRALTEPEWQRLQRLLDDLHYWSIPTVDPMDEPANDGGTWMLQAKREGLIHDVYRMNPHGKFREIYKYFLQLADSEQVYKDYLPRSK
jgi:hypothetical protein